MTKREVLKHCNGEPQIIILKEAYEGERIRVAYIREGSIASGRFHGYFRPSYIPGDPVLRFYPINVLDIIPSGRKRKKKLGAS